MCPGSWWKPDCGVHLPNSHLSPPQPKARVARSWLKEQTAGSTYSFTLTMWNCVCVFSAKSLYWKMTVLNEIDYLQVTISIDWMVKQIFLAKLWRKTNFLSFYWWWVFCLAELFKKERYLHTGTWTQQKHSHVATFSLICMQWLCLHHDIFSRSSLSFFWGDEQYWIINNCWLNPTVYYPLSPIYS